MEHVWNPKSVWVETSTSTQCCTEMCPHGVGARPPYFREVFPRGKFRRMHGEHISPMRGAHFPKKEMSKHPHPQQPTKIERRYMKL